MNLSLSHHLVHPTSLSLQTREREPEFLSLEGNAALFVEETDSFDLIIGNVQNNDWSKFIYVVVVILV